MIKNDYYCYLLTSYKRTYIGITNNLDRRIRQHNNIIKGGAKCTRGRIWLYHIIVANFTKSEALKFEYRWKRAKNLNNRIKKLVELLLNEEWKDKMINNSKIKLNFNALQDAVRRYPKLLRDVGS